MATIKDLAKKTGLGLGTISKYLNGGNLREENRVAIEAAIEELGFTVNEFARGLKTSRSRTIGVIIPELSNLFITSIITVVEDILRKSGYAVIICDCRTDTEEEKEAVRFLLQKRVDGIINMPVNQDGSHLVPALEKEIPVVLLDRMVTQSQNGLDAVLVDNASASCKATQALIQAGHKNIGILLGPKDIYTSSQRLQGYRKALEQNSLPFQPKYCAFSDYTVQGGYESMKHLISLSGLTSVFVTNYEMTLGAIISLNELSVAIPQQISIIGFDNLHLAKAIQPQLTIVTQPVEEIGTHTAEILLQRLAPEGKNTPSRLVTLSAKLVPGGSVAKI